MPPDVFVAMQIFTMEEWLLPFLTLVACGALSTLLLRRTPEWARAALLRRLGGGSLLLASAAYLYGLAEQWESELFAWRQTVVSRPGILACQIEQVGRAYFRADGSGWIAASMTALMFLGGIILSRAIGLHRVARASLKQPVDQ